MYNEVVPIKTLQLLLVAGAVAWALAPVWGGYGFGAIFLLTALTIFSKRRAARKKLAAHVEELGKSLTPEAVAWAQKHPLFYVWPEAAQAWGTTLKMTSLVMGLLSLWFLVRGFFFVQPWVWLCIAPATAVFFVGVTWGSKLDLETLLADDAKKPQKALHDEVKKVLTLQSLAGKWAPGEPA